MTTSTKIGQTFDRWILMDKNAATKNLFPKTEAFCHFTLFITFHVFPLPPPKELYLLSRFLCCVFVNLGFGRGKRRNRGSMAVFVVHAGFYRRVKGKTKAFLISLTSFQELHLMWVWVIAFVVSFNSGHNCLKFLTVTIVTNLRVLRRCMASCIKYTEIYTRFFKQFSDC